MLGQSEEPSASLPKRSFTSFGSWTGSRTLASIGTNSGSETLPFQGWRNFKEAFAPELIDRAVAETGHVSTILDPFGGSGTTALAAQFLGAKPTTIEVNPFLADLIEAKIAPYNFDALVTAYAQVRQLARGRNVPLTEYSEVFPDTFFEPGVKRRHLFSSEVAQRYFAYFQAIKSVENPAAKRLLRVLLAGLSVSVSNAVVSGKGRRYRRQWESKPVSPSTVDAHFEKVVLDAMRDLRRFASRRVCDYTLLRGDARPLTRGLPQQDLAVFSPPYPNSFDYTDVYNIELWMGGYLTSQTDNRSLREKTLRSHVQVRRSMQHDTARSKLLADTIQHLQTARVLLWNKDIPDMIGAYCHDLTVILENLHTTLRTGGRVYMVVGDSRYAGVDVPVARILSEIAPTINYQVLSSEPFRSMRASPQQGGQVGLPESLIILKKSI